MKYVDVDQIYKELERLEELIPVSDGKSVSFNYAKYIITALKSFIESMRREVIPSDEILRKAERDLFGSHESAAVEEAFKRYQTNYADECCLFVNAYELIMRIRTAFVEGVIWKENEELKEERS